MTIAICLKVGDGVVLGTDSASSIIGDDERYYNVYLSAEKTINLRKGFPIGMMTYGLGGLMGISIGSLARDLRKRLSGDDPRFADWALSPTSYTVEEVAQRVRSFFYDELYAKQFEPPGDKTASPEASPGAEAEDQSAGAPVPQFPTLGFMIAGFSAGDFYPEVWELVVDSSGTCSGPTRVLSRESAGAVVFRGMSEALNRLLYGWSEEAYHRLVDSGVSPEAANRFLVSYSELAHPEMPMQDAIDLVRYLADVTVGYVRFKAGAPTVAPPIDIAAVTRHQGFKWVARKRYYSDELNRPDDE